MSKLESGIIAEFKEGKFIISILDDHFVEDEIKALRRNACTLYYVSKGVVDLFLINIDDSLETSDIPFCVEDYREDQDFLESLAQTKNYSVQVRYVNLEGLEIATKTGTMDTVMSELLREKFKIQLETEWDEEAYEASLMKIQLKFEPFELEEVANAQCKL